MNSLRLGIVSALVATCCYAQSASLRSSTTALADGGGSIQLTAVVTYEGTPGAIGWSIALPANWTLVNVSGPNVPAIAPEAGSTGTLEFAYSSVPANRAEFTILVNYPAGVVSANAVPTVLIRTDGKLATLTPPAVELAVK